MTSAAAEAFDPKLLFTLRAAPWRSMERPFLLILTASIGLHICFAAYLASQPMPINSELSADDADRFRPVQQPVLPPLHKIPIIPNLPITRPVVAPTPATMKVKAANSGILKVL